MLELSSVEAQKGGAKGAMRNRGKGGKGRGGGGARKNQGDTGGDSSKNNFNKDDF